MIEFRHCHFLILLMSSNTISGFIISLYWQFWKITLSLKLKPELYELCSIKPCYLTGWILVECYVVAYLNPNFTEKQADARDVQEIEHGVCNISSDENSDENQMWVSIIWKSIIRISQVFLLRQIWIVNYYIKTSTNSVSVIKTETVVFPEK